MEVVEMILLCGNLAVLGIVLWNVLSWPTIAPQTEDGQALTAMETAGDTLAVLIPARNEQANIRHCISSVLDQGRVVSEILVLDDNSTDGTGSILEQLAETEPRLRIIHGQPLPANWSGKCWACQQLGQVAQADWLLFLDADARLQPGAVQGILTAAAQQRVSFLGAWPGMQMQSMPERWLMPLLNFLTFSLYPAPLARLRQNDPSLGLAHGACLLLKRETYHRLGGHRSVQNELFEDTRLARYWRRCGERSLCLDGQAVVHVRMYDSLGGIWHGFEKNFYPAFGRPLPFLSFMLLRFSLFLLPFLTLPFVWLSSNSSLLLTVCGIVLLSRTLLALRFGHPVLSILLHVPGELMLTAIAICSWLRFRFGPGVVWKGRAYRA
jgi:chlorobactene glucosyltransferase